jgi:cytochrome c peroxidase
MACATCHEQRRGFADGNRTHAGVTGEPGRRNVMSLANVGYLPVLTWADDRQTTLEAQALVPVTGDHPVEMGMGGHAGAIAERLGGDACYRRLFAAAFPETGGRIDLDAAVKAVAAFERTLVSVDAPYDRDRRGLARLPEDARRGAAVFERRCGTCHSGPAFTDARFHDLGLGTGEDPGVAEINGRAEDRGRFRTAGLRNVALSAPYLHDGRAGTLAEAIAAHGPEIAPRPGELGDVIAFLGALTDQGFVTDPRFSLPPRGCPAAVGKGNR